MSTSWFYQPSAPQAMPSPPSTASEDRLVKAETEEKLNKAADGERRSRGRASTILTAGMGLDSPTSSKKVLWGN